MKISDFIFQYTPANMMRTDSLCRVRLFVNAEKLYALITDVGGKYCPASVINFIENIKEQLIQRGYISESTILITHDEDTLSGYGSFDLVTFGRNNSARFHDSSLEKVSELLGCSHRELLDKTLKNRRLFDQLEQRHHLIRPFTRDTYIENYGVLSRRYKIKDTTITKSELAAFLADNPSERALAAFFKRDLAFFADLFAYPAEEYIVVPELKIEEGFVDYAILSGRSRMDVTLIEIKGANFDLMGSTGYRNFSYKTNEALQQVRGREGTIIRDYPRYRAYFHEIREAVETGNNRHQAFRGPKGKLEVDPDKDINIRLVVIAGRSQNDLEESIERHNLERHTSLPLRLESWDSLLNKISGDRNI